MKKTLLIITAVMLVVGCSNKPEKEYINAEKLNEEDGLMYHPDTKELYSGDVFKNYLGGKTEFEGSYKDGIKDGLYTGWYESGQKEFEGTYKNGEKDGKWTKWYEDGRKEHEKTYKDGDKTGVWTWWFLNGQKISEQTYKDGLLDGLYTWWHKNGQKKWETTFKDGQLIFVKCWDEDGNECECSEYLYQGCK